MKGRYIELSSAGVGPAGNFTFNFNPSMEFEEDTQAYLARYEIWVTVPNISPELANDVIAFTPDGGLTWLPISFPRGTYEIEQISTIIQQTITDYGYDGGLVSLEVFNVNTQMTLTTDGSGNRYGLDLSLITSGNFYVLTGFTPAVYLSPSGANNSIIYTSASAANITLGVNGFQFRVSGVTGGIALASTSNQGVSAPVIYSDSFRSGPGYQQSLVVPQPLLVPFSFRTTNSFGVQITDFEGNILDFNQGDDSSNNASSIRLQFVERDVSLTKTDIQELTGLKKVMV